jgi:hypothetical protein
MSSLGFVQLIPPILVVITLVVACYFFYTRYVVQSKELCLSLERIGNTIRSMSDGDENQRKSGVGRVFQDTPYDSVWREFAKTLHAQVWQTQGQLKRTKYRLTVPASHFFSVSSIVDRQLSVEYFKHLPGILTGVGIIGTFSGLLFGLSNFDATDPEKMSQSVAILLAGVRDAFYASAAAITAAMVITHWEKMIYRRCLTALDHLVNCLNGLFDGAVSEEYLATLVEHSANTSNQARMMKEEMIQAIHVLALHTDVDRFPLRVLGFDPDQLKHRAEAGQSKGSPEGKICKIKALDHVFQHTNHAGCFCDSENLASKRLQLSMGFKVRRQWPEANLEFLSIDRATYLRLKRSGRGKISLAFAQVKSLPRHSQTQG